jgi:hypothetical protein
MARDYAELTGTAVSQTESESWSLSGVASIWKYRVMTDTAQIS